LSQGFVICASVAAAIETIGRATTANCFTRHADFAGLGFDFIQKAQ
jgi:hypothetical protein